jgi:hypothetical protein
LSAEHVSARLTIALARAAGPGRFESLGAACNDLKASGLACHQQNSQFC